MFRNYYFCVLLILVVFILPIKAKVKATSGYADFDLQKVEVVANKVSLPKVKSPIVYIYKQKSEPLYAVPTERNTLKWYTVKRGGIGSTTAPTPSTTQVGYFKYWVSQVNAKGIESERISIDVYVNKANQKLKFTELEPVDFSKTQSLYLNATATSNLNVKYEVVGNSKAATVDLNGFVYINEPGEIYIKAIQSGNKFYNPAKSIIQKLVIENSKTILKKITINNVVVHYPSYHNTIRIDCPRKDSDIVFSNLVVSKGATILTENNNIIKTTDYGDYFHRIRIISADKKFEQHYRFKIEKRASPDKFVHLDEKNRLTINNSLAKEFGYVFIGYELYKNNKKSRIDNFYSLDQIKKETMKEGVTYKIVFIQYNGARLETVNFGIDKKTNKFISQDTKLDRQLLSTSSTNRIIALTFIE